MDDIKKGDIKRIDNDSDYETESDTTDPSYYSDSESDDD
jgi:hypothetical protein